MLMQIVWDWARNDGTLQSLPEQAKLSHYPVKNSHFIILSLPMIR